MDKTVSWVCSKDFGDFVALPDIDKYKKECNYYDLNGGVYMKVRPNGTRVSFFNRKYKKKFCSIHIRKQLIIYFTPNSGLVLPLDGIIGIQNLNKNIRIGKSVWNTEGVIVFSFGKIKIATHQYDILNFKHKLSMLFCKTFPPLIRNKKERKDNSIIELDNSHLKGIQDASYDYGECNNEILNKEIDDICLKIDKLQLKDSIKRSKFTFLKESSC
uniref:GRAM domain-containing protein n=1 Tax=Strongyloides venezuelensis TaxID=75913 RepID=A0A0K0EZ86_STRVS